MDEVTEIKYSLDNMGQPYFPATHGQAIQGAEDLSSGKEWIEFKPLKGKPNTEFQVGEDNGYKCSYRSIEALGLKINTIRLNISNVDANMNIANLPTGLTKTAQSWYVRTPTNRYPAVVTLRPSGLLAMAINRADIGNWLETDYIYGEYTWIE